MNPACTGSECRGCGGRYSLDETTGPCPDCGHPLSIVYDYDRIDGERFGRGERDDSLAHFDALLPISVRDLTPLRVGHTPLYALGEVDGVRLFIKDESGQPSGSLKDRASLLALAVSRSRGATRVALASTGNAAASTACLGASMGIPTATFIPRDAPPAKLAQARCFGASVFRVDGSYDDAVHSCRIVCAHMGWTDRTTAVNPFTREGKKTVAFEIAEQLPSIPDWVIVPTGDGNISSAVFKGFDELRRIGRIDRIPRIAVAQASGSAAITDAVQRTRRGEGGELRSCLGQTRADSIAVETPADGALAVQAVLRSDGDAIAVHDDAILSAMASAARRWGLFTEPAGAVSLAALHALCARGTIRPGESVVCLLTGSGLKDGSAALAYTAEPTELPAGVLSPALLAKIASP